MKLPKRIIPLFFAVFLLGVTLFAVTGSVSAASDIYEYKIISKKEKTCRITKLNVYIEEEVVIPSKIDGYTVVELGEELFKFKSVGSVTVPSTVTTIGANCFANVSELKTVKLSKGLTTIGDSAFCNSGLETITIPSTVKEIGSEAFSICKNLKSITVPSSVTKVGTNVFHLCSQLEKVDFLCNISRVPDNIFSVCSALKKVNLSSKVTQIGIGAFRSCDKLTTVTFSGAEKKVSECTFANSIPKGTIVIPNTVKVIDNSAFSHCDSIKNVFIGEGLTTLGSFVFSWCDALKRVVLPSTLETMGNSVFVYSEKVQVHSRKNAVYDDTHNCTKTVVQPSCAKGYTLNECKCGIAYKDNYVGAVIPSHKKVNITAVKATTKKAGRTAGTYCSVCNTIFKQSVKLEKVKGIQLSATSLAYNGKTRTPKVTVVDKNGKAISSSSYTVTFPKKSVNIGTYTVKVTLKGNYSGTLTKTYKIVPKGTSATKISRISNGFKIDWKKQTTKTHGYQIQYALNKDFKDAKYANISGNTNTQKSVKNLTAKKNYYVRIRTYAKIGDTKYYSSWSDTYKINVVTRTAKVIPQTQKAPEWPFGGMEYQTAYSDHLEVHYSVNHNYPGYHAYSATVYIAESGGTYKKVKSTDEPNFIHQYVKNLKPNTAYFFKVVVLFVPENCNTEKDFKKLTVAQKIYDETCSPEKFWTAFAPTKEYSTKSSTLKWSAIKGATGYIVREEVSKKLGYNIFGNPVFQHYSMELTSTKNTAKSAIKRKVSGVSGKTSYFTVIPYVKRGDYYYANGRPVRKKLEYQKNLDWF